MAQRSAFSRFANTIAHVVGHPAAFCSAVVLVVLWAVSGPLFGFSEAWQLVINTGTTVVTFLIVFILQHTQNKDSASMQLKLDELIRANENAHNATLDLEELTQDELEALRKRYERLAERAREQIRMGGRDTGIDPLDVAVPKER